MSKEIKDLLKPPFKFNPYDRLRDSNGRDIMQIAYYSGYASKFIVAALNEKWERDFGEPLRWEKLSNHPDEASGCPNCGMYVGIGKDDYRFWNHCPCCGQKLAPPEDGKE